MLHGLSREQKIQSTAGERGGIRRIVIRYSDGRKVNVMPDAERKTFSEDDAKELKKIFADASSSVEWAELAKRASM